MDSGIVDLNSNIISKINKTHYNLYLKPDSGCYPFLKLLKKPKLSDNVPFNANSKL